MVRSIFDTNGIPYKFPSRQHRSNLRSGVFFFLFKGKKNRLIAGYDQSEVLLRFGKWRVISVEFLYSFLRRQFARKPVVASQNVGCFLRLIRQWNLAVKRPWILNLTWPESKLFILEEKITRISAFCRRSKKRAFSQAKLSVK